MAGNQSYVVSRLSMIRAALERHAASAGGETSVSSGSIPQPEQYAEELMPAPPSLESLRTAFGLSPFETDVLTLCAGMELDAAIPALCAAAQGNPHRAYPTFGLALAALPEPHWSALTPAAPLRYWRLIELASGDSLTTGALRIDEHILHYITGLTYLDERLHGILSIHAPPRELVPSHRELADRIVRCWSRADPPVIQFRGRDSHAKRAIAAFACAQVGARLHTVHSTDLPDNAADRDVIARLWQREAALGRNALLIDCDGVDHPRAALAFVERLRGIVFVARDEPLAIRRTPVIRLEVHKPTAAEQQRLWRAALGDKLNGGAALLITQFDLDERAIDAAAAQSVAQSVESGDEGISRVWDACRTRARGGLDDFAQRVEPAATWDDLVVPPAQMQTLRDIATHVRCRACVYDTWGFASKGTRGLGISALFAGASGTGKTMAAEVLARELRLDLYRIDLSQVVSKYIGETEKNLRRVFDAAEASGAVLLFDEADALFGRRSDVKDSHDRYANIEVSYLLQRMESYRGLAILTTNMKSMLDVAFLRRLRFVVQFPAPDSAQRAEIWRRIFPARLPVSGIDVVKLARLNVAGGNIRNIALYAAFLAAEADEPVGMSHLLRAARGECAKIDRQMTDGECRDWL
jgi:hypothetical protein